MPDTKLRPTNKDFAMRTPQTALYNLYQISYTSEKKTKNEKLKFFLGFLGF